MKIPWQVHEVKRSRKLQQKRFGKTQNDPYGMTAIRSDASACATHESRLCAKQETPDRTEFTGHHADEGSYESVSRGEVSCTYRMRQDTVCDEDGAPHTVFGIEAVTSDDEILMSFPDVFFEIEKAQDFVRLCNEGHLSLLHLPDVVEDALVVW